MIVGVTYSDDRMTRSAELCKDSMKKYGVSTVDRFLTIDIDRNFYDFNTDILHHDRGAGYWLWKPYIIDKTVSIASDGDIIVYADAGVEFVAPVSHIIDRMDEDMFLFTNGFPHVEWCKGDVWNGILHGRQMDKTYKQVQASVIFIRVTPRTRRFVREWLLWCQMPGFIDDSPSESPNYPTFAEHRHDQAILTCLQIKYGYKLHFWPTNYSEHIRHTAQPGDNYPTLFNHHRRRNEEY